MVARERWSTRIAGATPPDSATCDYYGTGGYCQHRAVWDLGRRLRVVGLPYPARFSCPDHATWIVPYRARIARAATEGA